VVVYKYWITNKRKRFPMTLTKAYILEFDGYEGVMVDYLGNQIDFSRANVASTAVEYLQRGTQVLIEDDGLSMFIDLPEGSFNEWESEQRELFGQDTVTFDLSEFEDDQF
jgi:hypothetical protein